MSTSDATYLRLRQLHHHYVEKVNRLVAEDREDLIPEAVSTYADEALRELTAGEPPEAGQDPLRKQVRAA